jgi:predicted lipid-binding transport protein (Tim44 family)
MKTSWLMALCVSLAVGLAPSLSDAKRLGGGKSTGMQRDMPARTAPNATPATPAAPTQAAAAAPATAGAAAAAAPKRSWMGPIAGLAAGLGLAALMSHLGMGEAFANFLMIALLAVAAFFLVRFVMRRMAGGAQPAGAMAGGGNARSGAQVAWPPAGSSSAPQAGNQSPTPNVAAETPAMATAPAAAVTRAFVPASFDSEAFGRIAKTIFVRLQTANDSGDLDDIRRFTTPEMFAELRMDLQDRGATSQQTDVLHVDAEVLDVADDGQRQIVSVRFHGQIREEADGTPSAFDEVWHLVKPNDDSRNWAIAGIEQQAQTKH